MGDFRVGRMREFIDCILSPVPPPHIPNTKLPVSITSHHSLSQFLGPWGQGKDLCLCQRRPGSMWILACPATNDLQLHPESFPSRFLCSSVKRIPPVCQFHFGRTADRILIFLNGTTFEILTVVKKRADDQSRHPFSPGCSALDSGEKQLQSSDMLGKVILGKVLCPRMRPQQNFLYDKREKWALLLIWQNYGEECAVPGAAWAREGEWAWDPDRWI